jgi:MoaA/NifB/PqqE/SkfB family radical SAM enzyme
MPISTAIKIMKQASEAGVNSIKFNWRGEPTMNPDFASIIEYGYLYSRQNPGSFIDRLVNSNFNFVKDRDDILRAMGTLTKLKISCDSLIPSVYEKQRARGKFDIIMRNMDEFHDKYADKTQMVVQAVKTVLNKDEDLEGSFKARWPKAQVSIRDCVDNRTADQNDFSYIERDNSDRIACKQAFARVIFSSFGDAYPCCVCFSNKTNDQLKLGNIATKDLLEIFNSRKARQLRKSLKDKSAFDKFKDCKNCSSFESFKNRKMKWDS